MTYSDNEIMAGLQCCYHKKDHCLRRGKACAMCPFDENGKACTDILARNALDIINRQDEKIMELEEALKRIREVACHQGELLRNQGELLRNAMKEGTDNAV